MKAPTPSDILERVADSHRLGIGNMLDRARYPHLVRARQELAYLLRTEGGMTVTAIGRFLDRDHGTISRGIGAYVGRTGLAYPVIKMAPRKHKRPNARGRRIVLRARLMASQQGVQA